MLISAVVTPPNSLLFVVAGEDLEVPEAMEGAVGASSTCVSIGTRSEMDGPTEISLTDEDVSLDGLQLLYRGTLNTVLHRVDVQTVKGEQVAELDVPGETSTVTVHGSDPFEPARIVVHVA